MVQTLMLVRNHGHFAIIIPMFKLCLWKDWKDLRVCELIDLLYETWKQVIIYDVFNERDSQMILAMLIDPSLHKDKLIRSYTRNGVYSVKSAYYHATESLIDNSSLHVEGDWPTLWSINFPRTIKIFIKRTLGDCLPTVEHIVTKGVKCPFLYPFYNSNPKYV